MSSSRPSRAAASPVPGQEAEEVLLPVGAVAERLGMSTAALRAWERRYGLVSSGRSPGGHRRYSAGDLERLEHMRTLIRRGVPAADAARAVGAVGTVGLPDVRAGTAELTEAMHALDAVAVQTAVSAALARLGAAEAWATVLAPALAAIGEHWEETGRGVEVEHVTSGIVESSLRRHAQDRAAALPPVPGGRNSGTRAPVLLAAAPAEHHMLPLTALAAALAEEGRTALQTGDLPAPALTDALVRVRPGAVVLWARSHRTADLSWLRTALEAVPAPVPVHPAGPGWPRCIPGAAAPLHDLPGALAALLGAPDGRRPA
ncbi:MerR family transcriptional regulator [Streptomyces sp. CNQ085]|uniref:MerR family transcriptional regulator n=1 Tax=Streptomyces sp. CNQ085 TaxID=2886944 RepID=UPI001F50740A|nr:MerR family transcriptional regulator [Streptomyces sp. CNQ085]MCI0382845.1 MerR family transcriptional regulator [Streptomyces sp. CNQ085]